MPFRTIWALFAFYSVVFFGALGPFPAGAADFESCGSSQDCISMVNLPSDFRTSWQGLQKGEWATFEALFSRNAAAMQSSSRLFLRDAPEADRARAVDCVFHASPRDDVESCLRTVKGITPAGKNGLRNARARLHALLFMNTNLGRLELGGHLEPNGFRDSVKKAIREARRIVLTEDPSPPPEPPHVASIPDWDKCLAYSMNCAGQCATASKGGSSASSTLACEQNVVAVGSLRDDLGAVLRLSGMHESPFRITALHMQKIRAEAIHRIMRAYAQHFGTYNLLRSANLRDPAYAACQKNEQLFSHILDQAAKPVLPEDAQAYEVTNGKTYRVGMARAAADVVRNLVRASWDTSHAASYSAIGHKSTEYPELAGWVPDPDCSCFRGRLKLGAGDFGKTLESDEIHQLMDACEPECCSPSAVRIALGTPDGTSGTCMAWKNGTKHTGIAIHEIQRDLANYPALASGGKDLDELYDWKSLGTTLPAVRNLVSATYLASGASDASFDPALQDRGRRSIRFDALKPSLDLAMQSLGRELAASALKLCASPEDGGPSWEDLLRMSGPASAVLADNPEFRVVHECGLKAMENTEGRKSLAVGTISLPCVGLGAAGIALSGGSSLEAGLSACAYVLSGLAVSDYVKAENRTYLLGSCASAGAAAGNCTLDEAQASAREMNEAAGALLLNTAFLGFDIGANQLGRAEKLLARSADAPVSRGAAYNAASADSVPAEPGISTSEPRAFPTELSLTKARPMDPVQSFVARELEAIPDETKNNLLAALHGYPFKGKHISLLLVDPYAWIKFMEGEDLMIMAQNVELGLGDDPDHALDLLKLLQKKGKFDDFITLLRKTKLELPADVLASADRTQAALVDQIVEGKATPQTRTALQRMGPDETADFKIRLGDSSPSHNFLTALDMERFGFNVTTSGDPETITLKGATRGQLAVALQTSGIRIQRGNVAIEMLPKDRARIMWSRGTPSAADP